MIDNHLDSPRRSWRRSAPVVAAVLALAALSVVLSACNSDSDAPEPSDGTSQPAKNRPAKKGGAAADPDLRAVVKDIAEAVRQRQGDIARPILDQAVSSQKLTRPQADRFGEILALAGKGGQSKGGKRSRAKLDPCDPDFRAVRDDVQAAALKRRPQIAQPILDRAVKRKKIDKARAAALKKQFERVARQGPPAPKIDNCDKGIREATQEARRAFTKGGKKDAETVLDEAVKARKITRSEAAILELRATREPKKTGGGAE